MKGIAIRLARWTAMVLLLAFGWRVSAAYLSPCNQQGEPSRSDHVAVLDQEGSRDGCCPEQASRPIDDGDDDGDCSCPIHCGSGCEGAVMHALPPELSSIELGFAEIVMLPPHSRPSERSDAGPRDILHVPLPT